MGTQQDLLACLTTGADVVTLANIDAELIIHFKNVSDEGHIVEVIVWRVPRAVLGSEHNFKYRAAYVVDGARVIGFDNEAGKGDHVHIDGRERLYAFAGVDQLMEDFYKAIEEWRKR